MWKKVEDGDFNSAACKDQLDVTAITLRLATLLGLGLFWFALVLWIVF